MLLKVTSLAVALTALASPSLAQTNSARPEVTIKDVYARVIYRPEDRTDYAVTIAESGSDRLPTLQIKQAGGKLEIAGGLNTGRFGTRISRCNSGSSTTAPESPGQGGSATVDGIGQLGADEAPLIIISGPRNADIRAGGAVFGTVTRGAENVNLRVGGCGGWVVANTEGQLALNIGGNATVWAGTAREAVVNLGGQGRITTNAVRSLRANIGGAGNIRVASVDGDVDVRIGGSGAVLIDGGSAPRVNARIAGHGDIEFGGTAQDLEAVVAGSGRIEVERVTGNITRRVVGAGRIKANGHWLSQ